MNVAPANPNSPSTDGAAIGESTTRGRAKSSIHPSGEPKSTPAAARSRRSSMVDISTPFVVLSDRSRGSNAKTYRVTICLRLGRARKDVRGAAHVANRGRDGRLGGRRARNGACVRTGGTAGRGDRAGGRPPGGDEGRARVVRGAVHRDLGRRRRRRR